MLESVRKKNKQNCDPHWQKENNMLKVDAEANSLLKEQIMKETYADNAVQQSINEKILDLKNQAMGLAKTLEKEKRKNIQLEAIIKHVKFTMDEEKKKQATHRDDINYQSLDNLSRKIKKKQYDLDQIYSKSNELNSKNKSKKNEVDAYRTQRVIDSSIFLKIEKQLVQSQMKFKKLLIEKIKSQKQYQKSLGNYIRLKNDITKQQSKISQPTEKQDTPQDQFFTNAPEIKHAAKFTDIEGVERKKRVSTFGSKKLNSVHEVKEKSFEEEFAVRKIFLETGLNSSPSLIQHLLEIQKINQNLYKVMNDKADRVNCLLKKISSLKQTKERKKISYYRGEPKLTKAEIQFEKSTALLKAIEEIQEQTNQENEKLGQFYVSEQLRKIEEVLEFPKQKQKQEKSNPKLSEKFRKIQENLNPMLNCYQSTKDEEDDQNTESIKDETIDDVISKVKRIQESEKVMTRADFKHEYDKIKKISSKNSRQEQKKTALLKK